MKAQSLLRVLLLPLLGLLCTGCQVTLRNLTPAKIPENPSGIYTFTMAAKIPKRGNVSTKAYIVIGGETHPMRKTSEDFNIFKVDYKIPAGYSEATYYYTLESDSYSENSPKFKSIKSDLFSSQLVNRYILQMESYRGPVGAEVAVIGRGFSPTDTIIFGSVEIPIIHHSGSSISFLVPSLPPDQKYTLTLRSDQVDLPIGNFQIDISNITVTPKSLRLTSGDRKTLEFSIEYNAPPGGFLIPVTTNIPESIIMPEVIIPEGSRSVNVNIEGGETGMGKLYVEAPGFNTIEMLIMVY